MSYSDHDLVNFGQKHELDYILRKFDKRETQANRDTLVEIGRSCKSALGKTIITHGEFYPYVRKNLSKLD